MSLYGILHIPSGSFVHASFFSEGRRYKTFREEFDAWVTNSMVGGCREDSLFGFYIFPKLSMTHVNNGSVTEPVLFAMGSKESCKKIINFPNFIEQIAMDLDGVTDFEDFDETTCPVSDCEFSIVPLEISPTVQSIVTHYHSLPLRNDND